MNKTSIQQMKKLTFILSFFVAFSTVSFAQNSEKAKALASAGVVPIPTPADIGKIAQEMALATPRGQLVIIPGTGHTPHLEQPEAFNTAVLNFLKQNVATSTNLPSGN